MPRRLTSLLPGTRTGVVRFVTANLNKDKPGDVTYLRALRRVAGRPRVLALQEVGSGLTSTQVRVRGVRCRQRRRLVLGDVGVHRGLAQADVWIAGAWLRVMSYHGLHNGTVSLAAAVDNRRLLAAHCRELTAAGRSWAVGTDANFPIERLAQLLGGVAYGHGIEGWVVSRGVVVAAAGSAAVGEDRGLTDHPERIIDVPA